MYLTKEWSFGTSCPKVSIWNYKSYLLPSLQFKSHQYASLHSGELMSATNHCKYVADKGRRQIGLTGFHLGGSAGETPPPPQTTELTP